MKLRFLTAATVSALSLTFASSMAFAQDNPLLQPASENPLLQQAQPTAESLFEQQAREINAAATKPASDPVCVNIRTNYNQQLAEITEKSGQDAFSLSGINQMTDNSNSTAYRLQNINRNITGNSSGALGKATGAIGRGSSVINDTAAIGGLLGFGGKKMSAKKAQKKAAKLDGQAMDAVRQTGCPMGTFS
ncbi:MAG: hypothetical protein ABJG88_01185 [Litorimonas sp.]